MSSTDLHVFTDKDVKTCVEKFCFFLKRLEFDEAQTDLTAQRIYTEPATHPVDRAWQEILRSISQLAQAEHLYFGLGFLTPKVFFRKESSQLKDQYLKIAQDLQRIHENATSSCNNVEESTICLRKTITDHFANHCKTRVGLIAFYNELQSKSFDRLIESATQTLRSLIDTYVDSNSSEIFLTSEIVSRELQLLLTAFKVKQKLAKADMFNALLLIKQLRSQYSAFFADITPHLSTRNSSSGFLGLFGKTTKSSKFALLTWFKALYDALLMKFSLYFMDVLMPYTSSAEVRPHLSASLTHFSVFQRKCAPVAILIVMYRFEGDEDGFNGFGYHHPDTVGFTIGPPASTGVLKNSLGQKNTLCKNERFPVLMVMSSDKQKQFEAHKEKIFTQLVKLVPAAMPDLRTQYGVDDANNTTFCVRIEQKLFLVIHFDKKVSERESAVSNFIAETLSTLRFTKLYQELKSPSKATVSNQNQTPSTLTSSSSLPGIGPLM